jgi:hypothetical protein
MVTLVPPVVGPEEGLSELTVGTRAGATNVKRSAELVAEVPLGVVTVTLTVPADSAGLTAVIDVALLTVTPVAAVVPKST